MALLLFLKMSQSISTAIAKFWRLADSENNLFWLKFLETGKSQSLELASLKGLGMA